MPLTKSGRKILKSYRRRYGTNRGTRFFYATIRKKPLQTRKWHRRKSSGKRRRKRR